jgi:hypothetical protein
MRVHVSLTETIVLHCAHNAGRCSVHKRFREKRHPRTLTVGRSADLAALHKPDQGAAPSADDKRNATVPYLLASDTTSESEVTIYRFYGTPVSDMLHARIKSA